jgi:hypothetical protein
MQDNGDKPVVLQNNSAVVGIYRLEAMNCFAILYHSGELKLIGKEHKTIQVPKSATGNYLFCDCGNHFCVVSKMVLVTSSMSNTYEETAVVIYDKNGILKKDFHFHLQGEPIVNDLCYDKEKNQLHIVRTSYIHSISLDSYSEKMVECTAPQSDYAAYDGIIYKITQSKNGISAIDSTTGKDICNLTSHRSITKITPAATDSTILIIENNEFIYSCKLKQ